MIEKEIKKNPEEKRQMRTGGLFSTKERRVVPGPRYATSGNITMATNGRTYRIPNPYGATQVMFYGIATRTTTAGFNLTTNTFVVAPSIGANYELDLGGGDKIMFTVTGVSGSTTVFAVATNSEYPTLTTGTYVKTSGTGDVNLVVTSVAAPSVDIRVDVFGTAQLRPAYYFKPRDGSSVAVADTVPQDILQPFEKIIQSGKWFLVVDENASSSTPEYRARSTENRLVNIDWPGPSNIVVRATVVSYDKDGFYIEVSLGTNWSLQGNFVCT